MPARPMNVMPSVRPALVAAALALTPLVAAAPAQAQQSDLRQLLNELRQEREQEAQRNRQRVNEFIDKVEQREQMLAEARQRLESARARRDRLQAEFDRNEETLSELSTELDKRTGEFGEVFGVIRQVAGDARSVIQSSLTSSQYPERVGFLESMSESKKLPSIEEIERLWTILLEEMVATGEVARYETEIVRPDGATEQAEVVRVGAFNASVGEQFLQFTPDTQQLSVLPRQPAGRWQSLAGNVYEAEPGAKQVAGVVDPSRGAILGKLIQKPTLLERIQQGKLVGYVVILIGLIGLVIAGERLFSLTRIERRMEAQRRNIDQPRDDNPLGDVLSAYHDNRAADTETLQLKLDEAVLKNLRPLERGLSTIRILSAVAPLLGLLGTVVGMIATFQAITLFGTGDPKLMAGGISQALVTTVLGLIVAVPLILLHSLLNGRSRKLIQILEQQSAGIVASHAEQSGADAGGPAQGAQAHG